MKLTDNLSSDVELNDQVSSRHAQFECKYINLASLGDTFETCTDE